MAAQENVAVVMGDAEMETLWEIGVFLYRASDVVKVRLRGNGASR